MAHFSIISSQGGDTIFEGAPRYVGAYLKPGYLEFPAIGSPNPISWHVGDYVVYTRTGKTYRLYRTPQSIEQGESNRYGASFLYENVQFFDDSKQMEFCPFTDLVPGDNTVHFSTQNTVSFFGKPLNVAERLQACLEAQYGAGSWIIRIVTTTDADLLELLDTEVEFAVTGANCLEVLDQVYETWNGLGWIHTVENGVNVITIGASNVRTNANTTVPFSYGDGLVRVERSIANADQIGTRLFAYGSMKNMDATYYRGLDIYNAESVDIEHLMIPLANWGHTDNKPDARKAYIENAAAIAQLGLIPRTAYFDGTGDLPDIHPTIERMTIGEVYDAGGAGYLPNLSKWTRSQRVDEIVSAVNPDDNGTSADRGQKYAETISGTLLNVSEPFLENDTFSVQIYSRSLTHTGRLTLKFGQNPQIFTLTSAWNPTFQLNLVVQAGSSYTQLPLSVSRTSSTTWALTLPESVVIANAGGLLTVSINGWIARASTDPEGSEGSFATDATTTVSGGVEYELSKTFEVTIPQIGFDIDDYAALGNGKTISMKTGMCAGRDFEIKDATYVSSTDSWKLTLYRSVDEDLNIMFPNSDYEIAAGDQYVLLDIAMPEMYVTVASQRLLAAAQTLLADISVEQPFYAPQIDAKVVYNEGRVLLEGMWMHVRAAEGGDTMLESSDPADLQEFTGLFLASADTSRTNAYVLIDSITIDENGSNIPTYEVALRQRKGVEWTENVGRSTSSKSSVSVGSQDAQQQSGSVTSVGLSAPTGFVVEGSPVTGAGVLSLKLASGYKIPLESELASFFEVGALQTLIQLKSAYDYLGARDGLFFTGGDTSTPLPDLYVDVIQDAGGNNVRVLRSPLPLITGGDQIVTSGTPGQGGGGGGGGAEFLYQLSDVYGSTSVLRPDGTDRVAGDALVFVGGSLNKWAAKTLVASVAGLSGDVTVAQLATALSDAGYALTDTIYTLPVATSGALGGIKIGYTQSGKNYPVQLSSQKAYVNVPWTDVSFGTAGSDNVPITIGSTTKNVLTAHQSLSDYLTKTLAASTYVTNVLVPSGSNVLRVVKNGVNTDLTIPYAECTGITGINSDADITRNNIRGYSGNGSEWTGSISSMRYAAILALGSYSRGWQMWAARGESASLYWRNGNQDADAWSDPRIIYDSVTLTTSVVTGLIGDETYHPYGGGDIAFQASTLTATGTLTVSNDDAPATGEIRGGQIVLTRGLSSTANNSAGAITFYGRRLSGGYRNGARIASVRGGSWDLQDLVFYTSNNQDTAAPTFEEAMRIAYNKAVSINASLSIGTTLGVTGLATLTGGASIPATSSLQIGSATITWNSNGYLHIDKPLVTAGDQIVISGTPGGGGGGGATTLAGLDDTNIPSGFNTTGAVLFHNGSKWAPSTISSLATNDLLQWNGTTWANVAASSVGRIYSAGTGISISNANAISISATYAGGTAVTLNGVSKAASTASFYAPAGAGTTGQILKATTNGAPVWTSSALGGSSKPIYLNASGVLTEGVSCLPLTGGYIQSASGNKRIRITTDNSANYIQSWASDTASANLNISGYNGNAGSNLYLKFDNVYAWDGSANKVVYHAGNLTKSVVTGLIGSTTYAPYNADGYLPLSGGTLTGPLTKSSQVILSLSRSDNSFTAIEFLGKVDNTTDTALGRIGYSTSGAWVRDAADTAYRYIYHEGNLTKSVLTTLLESSSGYYVKKSGDTMTGALTLNADTTSHGSIYLDNGKYIYGTLSDGTTTANLIGMSSADQCLVAYGMRSTGTTTIYGQTMNFRSAATVGPEIHFGCSTHNKDAATIYFNSHVTDARNGIKIGAESATSADRLNLVVYTSNVGTSPYAPSWSPTLKVTYTGMVGIGLSAPSEKLHVDGNILSTGDQVVSSDLTKKTNLVPINLGIEQIAKAPAVTFDWKTGGHSFGSIAQYWKDVLGEAVLGTEGNYALAYGQLALVNTIVEAREIDKLKARVAELEAEVKRLTAN